MPARRATKFAMNNQDYDGPDAERAKVNWQCGVYFVRAGDFIKIGMATNVWRRVQGSTTWNPHEPIPMGWLHTPYEESAYTLERKLHQIYAQYRHRGEWFHAHPTLVHFIETRSLPWPEGPWWHQSPVYRRWKQARGEAQ